MPRFLPWAAWSCRHRPQPKDLPPKRDWKRPVFDARWVKPLPEKQLLELAGRFDRILCIEENALEGGFSSAVLELLSDNGALKGQHIRRMGLPDAFIEHGAQPLLRGNLDLTPTASSPRSGTCCGHDSGLVTPAVPLSA